MSESSPATPVSSFERLVGSLRAVAEPTRLRLVALLSRAELTVTEISQVIGQSQPRTSRHLRLLRRCRDPRAHSRGRVRLLPAGRGQRQRCRRAAPRRAGARGRPGHRRRPRRARARAPRPLGGRGRLPRAPTRTSSRRVRALHVAEQRGRARDARADRRRGADRAAARHRHRHRPHARAARAAQRAQHRARRQPRDAAARARARWARRSSRDALGAPGRSAPPAVRGRELRRRGDAPRAAPARRSRARRSPTPRGCCAPAAGCWSPTSRPTSSSFLRERHGHRQLGIADEDMRAWAGAAGLEIETERSLQPPGAGADERLTVRLWLLRARSSRAAARRRRSHDGVGVLRALPAAHARRPSSSCGRRSSGSRRCAPSFVSVTCGAGGSAARRDARDAARDRRRHARCGPPGT